MQLPAALLTKLVGKLMGSFIPQIGRQISGCCWVGEQGVLRAVGQGRVRMRVGRVHKSCRLGEGHKVCGGKGQARCKRVHNRNG